MDHVRAEQAPIDPYDIPLSDLGLSHRVCSALARAQIRNVGEVVDLLSHEDAILGLPNFGRVSLLEVQAAVAQRQAADGAWMPRPVEVEKTFAALLSPVCGRCGSGAWRDAAEMTGHWQPTHVGEWCHALSSKVLRRRYLTRGAGYMECDAMVCADCGAEHNPRWEDEHACHFFLPPELLTSGPPAEDAV